MPIDLNTYTVETLTDKIHTLRPGQALVSNDGQVVRRRQNSSGFDCGVGRGGHANRRKNSAEDAAQDMMSTSARHSDPKSLGGAERYETIQDALDSLRTDPNARPGPSPALKALRQIIRRSDVPSYRIRAERAKEALTSGNITEAIRNLEAIAEHATNHGHMNEIDRARAAIQAVREHHELDQKLAREEVLRTTRIELRTRGTEHFVYKDGKDMTGPLSRQEAERRRDFLVRKATQEEGVQEIDNEIAGRPNLVRPNTPNSTDEADEAA